MDPPSEADDNQVTEFLQRIRELDDKRDREDEERTRKLEEDILARREARQRLREERARSLSPEKMTPIGTPLSYRSRVTDGSPMAALQDSPLASRSKPKPPSTPEPTTAEARNDALEKLMSDSRPLPTPPSKPLTTASHTFTPSPSSVTGSTRRPFNQAGKPLSWQRRPQSVAFGERERPTFTQSTFSRTSSVAGDDNESDAGSEISRDQIAKNLGSKDPSYFRQTADRGFKSAALRRDAEDSYSGGGARMALPGMSDRTTEPPRPLSSLSNASGTTSFSAPLTEFKSISKAKSFLDSLPDDRPLSAGESMPWKTPSYASKAHQQIEASFSGLGPHEEEENSLMPSAYIISNSGRNSPEKMGRPPSPTKGLGGFVQSAMLKRDASVRKPPVGNPASTLSRSGSNVSDKERTTPIRRERALSTLSRDGTPAPEDKEIEERRGREMSPAESVVSTSTDGWRGRTEATPPTSPSKTMNPRRWSPTKSSWLESALQKDIAPVIGSQPPLMFSPSRESSQRSPTRDKSIRSARDAAAIREERARARAAAHHVPRKMSVDSQTDHPRFDSSSFSRPTIQPKSAMLSKRPLSEIFNPPPAFDFAAPFEKTVVEEEPVEEAPKPEASSSIPRPAISSKPSIPEKLANGTDSKDKPPIKSKPVFERGPGKTMTIDPRAAREASLREQQQAKKDGVLDFRSRLSPTKTQNYKAPDELKETILAGKSALQDRGGPQNYKPPNELKQKVLAAKASLQDRGGPQNYKAPNELKEVVAAARGSLQTSSGPQKYQAPDPLKETVSVARSHLRPSSPVKNSPIPPPAKPSFGRATTIPVSLEGNTNAPSRRPDSGDAVFEGKENPIPAVSKQTTAPARMEKSGGKLADRFNPGLAGILSRGPMGMGKPGPNSGSSSTPNTSKPASKESAEGPQLTHMTKGRARGPRRRAPAAASSSSSSSAVQGPRRQRSSLSPHPRSSNPTRKSLGQNGLGNRPLSPAPITPRKPSAVSIQYDDQEEPQSSGERKEKPPTPAKSPLLRAKSSTFNIRDSLPSLNSNPTTPISKPRASLNSKSTDEEDPAVKPLFFTPQERGTRRLPTPPSASVTPSPGASRPLPQLTLKPKPSTDSEAAETIIPPSVKDSISRWGSTNSTPDTTPQRKSMIKLPTYQDEVAAMESSKAYRSPQAGGVSGPTPSPLRLGSSRAIDESILNVVGIDAAKYLSQFFTGPVTNPPKGGIDVTPLLESKPKQSNESVQTLKKQMWEITGINGKKDHVPVGQEHILYEDGLYMCLHSYMENNGMMASEVFLWSGDRVSLGTVEEAQLSARRLAREYDGRLIVTQQGKEVPRFIEALGGVIITRRGSRARIQQDIPYMLCCRKVAGGIAFDEVDIHFTNLCSGFPYIISTPDRLYLWKGKGASIEELRAARVASFDLAGDNEVKQIDEDKEPEFFVEMMGGEPGGQVHAQYWCLKPQHMQYTSRVFLVDHESPNSAVEIHPFAQSDLDPTNIYIIDAFFELYIIVGEQAQDKRIDFQHALLFTQEYSIMAASNEDRPFVPPSNVVLGGAPKELKAVFRRWEDSKTPTAWHPSRSPSVKLTMGLRDAMSMMDF
ncbi:hypothetical protein TWF102_002114 [Orbilia oligospora]|uniref:DUF4045 domain-containing protein n=1 Tax=Orbilia oligospora TaxID=2813651 RepID=A0A7C8J0N5_ORBOL|nr:hypothetical protein TWF102_002114 [Orbilia oligospora]KAF3087999.1 hypothetical protein TWF706_010983 [Orbilia oligospora]KAF3115497.1 hypothetical protein TWF103_010906 [Orbilia oligospora]KAF3143848.1 hypothetical protein TWF594_004923 [Orbilia oligospora]